MSAVEPVKPLEQAPLSTKISGRSNLSSRKKSIFLNSENLAPRRETYRRRAAFFHEEDLRYLRFLGRVDGFDQDEAESKRDERAVILRRLLASKCDTLEAFELADRLFDACPCLVECFRKEGGHILGVGSIRDCRTYSALARGVAI